MTRQWNDLINLWSVFVNENIIHTFMKPTSSRMVFSNATIVNKMVRYRWRAIKISIKYDLCTRIWVTCCILDVRQSNSNLEEVDIPTFWMSVEIGISYTDLPGNNSSRLENWSHQHRWPLQCCFLAPKGSWSACHAATCESDSRTSLNDKLCLFRRLNLSLQQKVPGPRAASPCCQRALGVWMCSELGQGCPRRWACVSHGSRWG